MNVDTSNQDSKKSERTQTLTDTNFQQDAKKDGKHEFSSIIEIETPRTIKEENDENESQSKEIYLKQNKLAKTHTQLYQTIQVDSKDGIEKYTSRSFGKRQKSVGGDTKSKEGSCQEDSLYTPKTFMLRKRFKSSQKNKITLNSEIKHEFLCTK